MAVVYVGGRGDGKTLRMIKRSAETRSTIVVLNSKHVERIKVMAKKLGYDIPEPMGISQFRDDYYRVGRDFRNGVLIDDFDLIIRDLFKGVPINAITVTNDNEVKNTTFIKIDKEDRKEILGDDFFVVIN